MFFVVVVVFCLFVYLFGKLMVPRRFCGSGIYIVLFIQRASRASEADSQTSVEWVALHNVACLKHTHNCDAMRPSRACSNQFFCDCFG